ncbi:hypothetical protein HPP92_021615 [Vanilla planifolia]|uniref:Uncharacterized protein n=1 Tax=Vanilla planifolia TaxID=51239 RepID=A0A835Q4Z8_VANPL|nr:hypothetical protein HPP92_021949 [Vanilla planifolia]KAG0463139.1 hypothetical protein HPP92_021615 [Vanilla planifolia]
MTSNDNLLGEARRIRSSSSQAVAQRNKENDNEGRSEAQELRESQSEKLTGNQRWPRRTFTAGWPFEALEVGRRFFLQMAAR